MDRLNSAGPLTVYRLVVGSLDNNVYIVTSGRQAVVIDAAAEADRILAAVAGFEVTALLTTHGHHDHVGAAREVAESLGIPFRLHPADAEIAGMAPEEPIADGDEFPLAASGLTAIHTPGHTPGSTSFRIDRYLFTGDTLFPGGPGATRFPYSDFDEIMESLEERLFVFDDDFVVMPGHGDATTLGAERPFLDEWRARRW